MQARAVADDLDIGDLLGCARGKTFIGCDREPGFSAILQPDANPALLGPRPNRLGIQFKCRKLHANASG